MRFFGAQGAQMPEKCAQNRCAGAKRCDTRNCERFMNGKKGEKKRNTHFFQIDYLNISDGPIMKKE